MRVCFFLRRKAAEEKKGLGRTEYRFAEYEYDEIRCEAANEKITEDEELRHQHTRCRIRSQQTENRSLGGMPQAPGWLAQPEAQLHQLAGSSIPFRARWQGS